MTKIKVCGITNLEDGLNAVNLGVDYIGFVFYEKSSRYITPEKASCLSKKLNGVEKVGLFVNENPEKVRNITDLVNIDIIQLHGDESPEYCRQFRNKKIWKALKVKDKQTLSIIPAYDSVDAILLDANVKGKLGGTGETFDWDLAVEAKKFRKKIILAGGLNSLNITEAIKKVNPYAVDVSSGVEESKGKKSYNKMKAFIDIVKVPSVLLKIVEEKKTEVKNLYESGKVKQYKNMASNAKRSFYDAISQPGFNLIAEFKKASPSKGIIRNAEPEEISKLYEKCEYHNKKDIEKAIKGGADIFGINNRNLHDFSVNRKTTLELLPYIPEGSTIVTESGIKTHQHVKELSHPRINAMLVGEAIMSSELNPRLEDMENKIYELLGKSYKNC